MKYDEIGEWSEIKLEIIKEYARAYTSILSKKLWCKGYAYIDAFAGAGVHKSKSTGELVAGSPTNALQVRPPFTDYHYIDLDNRKVDELEQLAGDEDNVYLYRGDCNEILMRDIFQMFGYSTYRRALCVLDPYGLHLGWDTVKMAGQLKTVDIFINFSIMDANRNVLHDNLSKTDQKDIERMDLFWGDKGWRDLLYQKQDDLFGETHDIRKGGFRRLALEYRKRLQEVAGFKFVPEPVLMTNSKNGPLYYLYFASPQQVAEDIITDIFRKHRQG